VNPDHLRVGTHLENQVEKGERGRAARGEIQPNAKLTSDMVSAMREMRSRGCTYAEIARATGVHKSHARRVVLGMVWSHV
jgi:hypothetical protein